MRYLKLLDECEMIQLEERYNPRVPVEKSVESMRGVAALDDTVFAISRVQLLAYRTSFDYRERRGAVPINVSLFPEDRFPEALHAMREAFETGLCVSNLVATASGGKYLGELVVPRGKIGLATVCSIVVNGALLKAGAPMDSRFGGVLQIHDRRPIRFTELIYYSGCTLDPSEIFIKARMTSVRRVAERGEGRVLANYREIPAVCRATAEEVITGLRDAGLGGVLITGSTSEPVCELPIGLNRIGIVLIGGLNPVAAAEEAGIKVVNHSMSTIMEYRDLVNYQEL